MLLQAYGQANSPLKRWLLEFAYRRKAAEIKAGIVRRDSIWDRLIFRKVQVEPAEPAPLKHQLLHGVQKWPAVMLKLRLLFQRL